MYLQSLGELALASRLKALSDQFYGVIDEAYRACGAPIESRWFPVLRYLWEYGPATVTDVAVAISQTHSAVSQMSDTLVRAKLLRRRRDPADGRRTRLALTAEGERRLATLGPMWCAMRRSVAELVERSGSKLLQAVDACEATLAESSLPESILQRYEALSQATVEVLPYRPAWRDAFQRLNEQWLRRHFVIEDVDRKLLEDPQRHVLALGGAIFVAVLDGEPIGTCALLKEADGLYELSKMCVDESFRGLGAGHKLLDATIAEFHARGGGTLFLESNSRLQTAVRMYERAGFEHQPQLRPGSHYARADVYMIYRDPGREGAP